jgi:peptidoglycan/xylan/chitin deacetylase (PgdA/CDA1 family)
MAALRVHSLMYHDVVVEAELGASGFTRPTARAYKVGLDRFREQLDAVAAACAGPPAVVTELPRPAHPAKTPFMLTFDDGGVSAHTLVGPELERLGWRGHFFVTTSLIGERSFLDAGQIRDLHERGHVIGSHSHTHPTRMAGCGREQLHDEWARSAAVLEALLGTPITTASVPGGHYAEHVAEEAASAGVEALFTSEPTSRSHVVDGCLVLGRYTIAAGTPATVTAGLASGALAPRFSQRIRWGSKKVAKTLGGRAYLGARARLRDVR